MVLARKRVLAQAWHFSSYTFKGLTRFSSNGEMLQGKSWIKLQLHAVTWPGWGLIGPVVWTDVLSSWTAQNWILLLFTVQKRRPVQSCPQHITPITYITSKINMNWWSLHYIMEFLILCLLNPNNISLSVSLYIPLYLTPLNTDKLAKQCVINDLAY